MGGRYLETSTRRRLHEHSRLEGTNQRARFTIFIFYPDHYLLFPNGANHPYCSWKKFQKTFSAFCCCCYGLCSSAQPPFLCATPEFGIFCHSFLQIISSCFIPVRMKPSVDDHFQVSPEMFGRFKSVFMLNQSRTFTECP